MACSTSWQPCLYLAPNVSLKPPTSSISRCSAASERWQAPWQRFRPRRATGLSFCERHHRSNPMGRNPRPSSADRDRAKEHSRRSPPTDCHWYPRFGSDHADIVTSVNTPFDAIHLPMAGSRFQACCEACPLTGAQASLNDPPKLPTH